MKNVLMTICLSIVMFFGVSNVNATIIPMGIFTNNGGYNNDPGFNVYVDVFEVSGKAVFEIHNESSFDCIISEVYFDDGSLLGISTITNFSGVSFSQLANPSNLPAGQNLIPIFETTEGFSMDADNPAPKNGIGLGEKLQIAFSLQSGRTFADVSDELMSRELRIGMHVISFSDGSSESAVNVPEPATLAILGLGSLLLRRKS